MIYTRHDTVLVCDRCRAELKIYDGVLATVEQEVKAYRDFWDYERTRPKDGLPRWRTVLVKEGKKGNGSDDKLAALCPDCKNLKTPFHIRETGRWWRPVPEEMAR